MRAAIAILLLATSVQAQADASAVAATVARFHAAVSAGDAPTALSLLADDAVILEAGALETLEEYRKHHLAADMAFARAVGTTRRPARVTVHGDVAWAASTSEALGTFDGRPVDALGAELIVLTRTGSGWRIRAVHWSSRRRP